MSHDAEMDAAMARIGVLRFRLDETEAELTDLKSTTDRFEVENSILMKETARLMAEVEHLTSENLLVREEADRYCRLWQKAQVEVERLTKYGDVLESGLRTLPGDFPRCLANEWKAAKEGKQS